MYSRRQENVRQAHYYDKPLWLGIKPLAIIVLSNLHVKTLNMNDKTQLTKIKKQKLQ